MGTTPLGIAYPDSTDTLDVHGDMQALAEDVDGLIDTDRDLRDATASDWSPTFAASTSGGTIGNATVTAKYLRQGRKITFWGNVVFGTTTSMGSGTLLVSLPVTSAFTSDMVLGPIYLIDVSASARRAGVCIVNSSTNMILSVYDGVLVASGSSSPWTWTTSDIIRFSGTYMAASL